MMFDYGGSMAGRGEMMEGVKGMGHFSSLLGGGVTGWIFVLLWITTWIFFLIALIAFARWMWKKGEEK